MSYAQMAREIIKENYPRWEVVNDAVLLCPCGERVEYDGQCPEGHVSPLREMGMI